MEIENILKIADIHSSQISSSIVKFLQDHGEVTYKDRVLKEDIYNIDSTLEEIELENLVDIFATSKIKEGLEEISKLLAANDCGYLRIVYS